MSLFDIVWNNVPDTVLPVDMRQPVHKAWLRALINGTVSKVYASFFSYKDSVLYFLNHNSQVCYMEAALNDMFDPVLRRIYIEDAPIRDAVPLYTRGEGHEVPLYTRGEAQPVALYTRAEILASIDGFIVKVPGGLAYDPVRLKALVNTYRLPSKQNWMIRTF